MVKIIVGTIIGGVVGFGTSYLVKCASGTCPLSSNPIISTIIGAVLGAMVAAGL